jgi:hypothetical protein
MQKPWHRILLAIAVAGASIVAIVFFWLSYLMRSMPSLAETTMSAALAVITVGFCAALVNAGRPVPGWRYRLALAMMLGGAVAPFAVDATRAMIEKANDRAERSAFETKFLAQLGTYKKDVAERIAAKKPFAPREAQEFLEFVQGADLSHRLLPDYSSAAFALLKQALDAKVLDPNALVRGKRSVDVADEPLFVVYYEFYLQSGATMPTPRVRAREWTILQMLIAGGANLDDPAAAVLRDVVKRETEPYDANVPGYVRLK